MKVRRGGTAHGHILRPGIVTWTGGLLIADSQDHLTGNEPAAGEGDRVCRKRQKELPHTKTLPKFSAGFGQGPALGRSI